MIPHKNYILIFLLGVFSFQTQAQKKKRHFAYINVQGEVVIDTDYKWAKDFSHGRAQFKKVVVTGDKAYYNYGFIDETGREVIPAIYDKVYDFKTDVTWVRKRGEDKYILIDKNGRRVGNTSWDDVGFWFEDMCKVKVAWDDPNRYSGTSYKEGFVNKKGEIVIDPSEGYFGGFYKEGVVCVAKNSSKGYGFLDKNGKVVIPLTYKQGGTSSFQNGLARMKMNGKTGLINKNNEWVVTPKYSTVSGFGDSLLVVAFGSSYNNFGYVNFNNEVVIKGQYDGARPFIDGMALVEKDGKWGIINKEGEIIIPFVHDILDNSLSEKGYFRALNDRKFTYYNADGKGISEIEAKSGSDIFNFGIFAVQDDSKKVQYYNSEGQLISNSQFCKGGEFSKNGLALVELCEGINYPKGKLIKPEETDNSLEEEVENALETENKAVWKTHTSKVFKTTFSTPGEVKETRSKSDKGLPKTKMETTTDNYSIKVLVDQLSGKINASKKEATLKNAANKVLTSSGAEQVSGPETFTIDNETAVKHTFVKNGVYFLHVLSSKDDLLYQWIFSAKQPYFEQHLAFLKSIRIL